MGSIRSAVDEGGDGGRTGAEGEHSGSRRRPCRAPEERDEDTWDVTDVLVDEKPNDAIRGEGGGEPASGAVTAGDDVGAETRPETGHDEIEPWIKKLTDGDRHRDTRATEKSVEELPVAAVCRDQNRAVSGLPRRLEVFEAGNLAEIQDLLRLGPPQVDHLCQGEPEVARAGAE